MNKMQLVDPDPEGRKIKPYGSLSHIAIHAHKALIVPLPFPFSSS